MNIKAIENMLFAIEEEAIHRYGPHTSDEQWSWVLKQHDRMELSYGVRVRINVFLRRYEWQEVTNGV